MINVGDKVPAGTFMRMTDSGPGPITTDEIFSGKTVVFFAVPGAFTPTCSAKHVPGYVTHAAELKAKGVDQVVCMSVNDVFVMNAWGKDQGAGDAVLMVADGNGDYARTIGLTMDGSKFGMGTRAQRFSFIAKDGVITHLNVEAPGEFKVSSAEHALSQL